MKKKLTIAIIIGFVSLIAGLILAGIGLFTGGITRLEEISKPEQVEKSYTSLSTIQLEHLPYTINIKESSDHLFHVSYANPKNNTFQSLLSVKEKDGALTISSQETEFSIQGIMQFFGEELAKRKIDVYSVTIEVPKDKKLDKLSSTNAYVYYYDTIHIENIHIKEIAIEQGGSLYLSNVQLDSGNLSSAYMDISGSTLKNTNIYAQGERVLLYQSKLENLTIENYNQLDVIDGTLIGNNQFIPLENRAFTVTNIDLTDSSLADVNLSIKNKLDRKKIVESMGYYYETEEELEEAMNELNLIDESQLKHIGIFTRDQYEQLEVKQTNDNSSLTLEKKESKNKLTLEATNATINLRTPK
ncbi:TPA: hypothetical protein ACGOTU_000871 [Streptococcus suis]